MLDITTNPNIMNCAATMNGLSSGGLDTDEMDPLFDDDWLHEHNLDILFDLFEEEMESSDGKVGMDSVSSNGSSTIFGTSPITSYLFGTSPSLASALDLYDLLYFDNQQTSSQQQTSSNATTTTTTATATTTNNNLINNQTSNYVNQNQACKAGSLSNVNGSSGSCVQQVNAGSIANPNSITNAMRIKRKCKKGQSEGISLLAKPFSTINVNLSSNKCNKTSSNNHSIINKNNSDKTSSKITNFKKSIVGKNDNRSGEGIDINYSKQNQQNRDRYIHHHHHHVHYITGCAVIREHAYAVRGH